jgi:hypothetical protein
MNFKNIDMKEIKADKARRLFAVGDLKGALGIYKGFPFGFTKEEKRAIEIAYESLIGREAFYQRLGIDTAAMIAQSKEIINLKHINHES